MYRNTHKGRQFRAKHAECVRIMNAALAAKHGKWNFNPENDTMNCMDMVQDFLIMMVAKNGGRILNRKVFVEEGSPFIRFQAAANRNAPLQETLSRYLACDKDGNVQLNRGYFKKDSFQENPERSLASQRNDYREDENVKGFTVEWSEDLDIMEKILEFFIKYSYSDDVIISALNLEYGLGPNDHHLIVLLIIRFYEIYIDPQLMNGKERAENGGPKQIAFGSIRELFEHRGALELYRRLQKITFFPLHPKFTVINHRLRRMTIALWPPSSGKANCRLFSEFKHDKIGTCSLQKWLRRNPTVNIKALLRFFYGDTLYSHVWINELKNRLQRPFRDKIDGVFHRHDVNGLIDILQKNYADFPVQGMSISTLNQSKYALSTHQNMQCLPIKICTVNHRIRCECV